MEINIHDKEYTGWSENPEQAMNQEDAQTDFELRRASLEDAPIPDVDEAFEQFKTERLQFKRSAVVVRMWALAAAVACLVVAFFLPWNKWLSSTMGNEKPVIAKTDGNVVYEAQKPMKDVALTMGDKTFDLHSEDAQRKGFSVNNDEMIRFLTPENVSPEDRTTLMIPQGKTARLLLPDGTKVWLSACSRLIFPQKFLENAPREVRLIGEAYFEVTHDEARPFIVHSGNISTTVLGTTFNIRCFEGEQPCVTLASGRVRVTSVSQQGKHGEVTLSPGQQAFFNKNSTFNVEEADLEGVLSWKNGGFYFENQTLREALTEIGRWYNYNVIFTGNEHLNDRIHYNGERSWTVKQVIEQLNRICDTNIKIKSTNIVVND